jgi:hypothetical protein
LGRAIRGLLEDDGRRTKMAVAGRARAERLFSYPELTARLERWLEDASKN